MMRWTIVFIGVFLAGSILSAKTPQQLKAEMDAVLPTGMKVRMAWCGGNTAYVYDSEENALRDLTPTSVFGSSRSISKAFVSQDGEYVVLKDKNSDAILTVKFDGTGKQKLFGQGTVVCTWVDPSDNKQCFIASGLPSPNNAGTWAVGITDQTKRKQVSTEVFPKTSSNYGFGCGISVDGKMMGGFNNNRPGLWSLPSGSFVPAGYSPLKPAGVCEGCNFAIRPTTGGVYEYGHFHEDHRQICVHTADGKYKEELLMGCAGIGGEAHGLYWTNHLDYVTATVEEASPNPVLFDVKRQKCVALKDDCGDDCGFSGPNAVLLSKSGATESRTVSPMMRIPTVSRTPQKLYSINGRLLSKSQIGASVRSLRIPVGNQAAGIIVGCR